MSRYALLVHYDGTEFNGWQIQAKGRTIQAEFERSLKILTREDVRITASGRTDAGVHALGQVAHFDLSHEIPLKKLCMALNGIMANDVSVKNAYSVPKDFHARFSAVQREYVYKIYRYPLRTPFMKNRALWINHELDVDYVRSVADLITGEKDFASFCKKISTDNGTVRKIENIEVTEDDNIITLRITGNAFLHNMIRIIIGTIVQMYREGREPEYVEYILQKKDRDYGGFTASPHGLYLKRVSYDPGLDFYESAF